MLIGGPGSWLAEKGMNDLSTSRATKTNGSGLSVCRVSRQQSIEV